MSKKSSDPGKIRVSKDILLPGVFFALFVRWCVAAYPYSGYRTPPMYGDYEAQRHWQEITLHLPTKEWYQNTTHNDLEYWGLDYPPLTAYHSMIMGVAAEYIEPESVRLFASRGYETSSHKRFMRWTVILSDIYFFFLPVLNFCIDGEVSRPKALMNVFKRTDVATVLFLLYPGIILIDHGHFQYNCVSLGLFIMATIFIVAIDNEIVATGVFVLALNYKQMELYHALPFFVYLLRNCFIQQHYKSKFVNFIHRLNKLAVAVISLFVIIWYPFIGSWDSLLQVVHRLFPLKRGVFEDKVSNVWCVMNVFIKLKTIFTNEEMAKLCLIVTAIAVTPSCLDLFMRQNKKKFVLSLINVSLAFFLFSFQVHEKTILLVAIPVAMHFSEDPFMCFWFLLVSTFSMLPLLLRDGLLIPFIATNIIYVLAYSVVLKVADSTTTLFSIFSAYRVYNVTKPKKIERSMLLNLLSLNFLLSCFGMVWLSLAAVFMKPLPKFPDLIPLVISAYSCSHFLLFFLYFNYQQYCIPKTPVKIKYN